MATNISGTTRRRAIEIYPDLGMLCSPRSFRFPWCRNWAADNDMFNHPAEWWNQEGERAWLRMLDRLAVGPVPCPPLFCALPDVVANWDLTIERSRRYRHEVEDRGFKTALVLQDGCRWEDVRGFGADALFVGGSTRWKWSTIPTAINLFGATHWIHIGRVNGERRIRLVRKWGADSADGSGLVRHFDAVLPGVLRGLYDESPQLALMDDRKSSDA